MLGKRENSLFGQSSHLGSHLMGQLILFGVYTTDTECSYVHACSSFTSLVGLMGSGFSTAGEALGATVSGLGFGAGKLTAWMAFVGHTSTHFLHMRHLLKSM